MRFGIVDSKEEFARALVLLNPAPPPLLVKRFGDGVIDKTKRTVTVDLSRRQNLILRKAEQKQSRENIDKRILP